MTIRAVLANSIVTANFAATRRQSPQAATKDEGPKEHKHVQCFAVQVDSCAEPEVSVVPQYEQSPVGYAAHVDGCVSAYEFLRCARASAAAAVAVVAAVVVVSVASCVSGCKHHELSMLNQAAECVQADTHDCIRVWSTALQSC
jgi:hypothetical protein